jgi:hypothetical protein
LFLEGFAHEFCGWVLQNVRQSGRRHQFLPVPASPCESLNPTQVQFVKRDTLFFALNETTHALRFAESVARRFSSDVDVLA